MGDTGLYLYAVSRELDPARLHGVEGLSHRPLAVIDHDGLSAVVSEVDLDEYGEEGLRANLERLEWLEVTARTHDAVVHAVAELGPVAPMRLATIFLDEAGLRRRLGEWFHAIEQVLERVEGRREWSVKVLTEAAAAEDAASAVRPASGAEYLRQKKAQGQARAAREADTSEQVQRLHEALSTRAVASRTLAPQDPRLTGHQGAMVLNAAYLVEAAEGGAFAKEADAWASAHPHLQLDVRGPWPPYSFAMLEQR
jgi:hypothetical protein